MAFELPNLPYAHDALAPSVDARTMEIHHGKHHNGYVTKLNKALEGHADLQGHSIEDLCADVNSLPQAVKGAVRNNGGGHFNHSLFWQVMTPGGSGASDTLTSAIAATFGSMDDFKRTFGDAAGSRFGSGWAWLCVGDDGKLFVTSTPNQDNPLMKGVADKTGTPILGLDVWEHAYYLNYQNRRPDYVSAWWDVVNWEEVSRRFDSAT